MAFRTLTLWESLVGIAPSAPVAALPARSEILIVGAGFAGSWLAYFLRRKFPKLQITIVERDFFTLGASARNAGFLSCGNITEWLEDSRDLGWEETLRTFDARLDGIRIILDELGEEVPVEPCGSFDFDEITDEKIAFARKLNEHLRKRGSEPFYEQARVRLGGREHQAFRNRFDGAINPVQILTGLHRRLHEQGVRFVHGAAVRAIGKGEAVFESGARLNYDYAFVCVNGFAKSLHPGTGVAPARGQVIVTSPCRTDTVHGLGFFHAGYDYFRFIGERVLVGGGRRHFQEKENTDELTGTAELRAYLHELAIKVIGHDRFEIEHHWAGIMGLRAGRHAGISELREAASIDSQTEELSSCAGWGVTLTPYVTKQKVDSWRP